MKFYLSIILFQFLMISTHTSAQNTDEQSLTYLIREPKTAQENPPLLLMLHGVGSNEKSMYQLADYLHPDYLVVFVRAPFVQGSDSYKWYTVDFSTGKPVINQKEADQSREILTQFIGDLEYQLSFDKGRVFLGGFSQGAIMSYSVGYQKPALFEGVLALSGRMMEQTKLELKNSNDLGEVKTLIIHGKQDNVLPIAYARQAKSLIESFDGDVSYHEINEGHGMNGETIQLMNSWLDKAVKKQ